MVCASASDGEVLDGSVDSGKLKIFAIGPGLGRGWARRGPSAGLAIGIGPSCRGLGLCAHLLKPSTDP